MKRILVLGSRGYLGKHLIKKLREPSGNEVITLREFYDLRNYQDCQDVASLKFDELYQFAATSGNMKYILSEEFSYGDSTLININIIKALKAVDYKGKILFPSTFYAYDTTNRYGLEKLYNENLYLTSGLDVRIARLFSVFGPGEKLNSSGEKVTTAFCRKFIESTGEITIEGSPTQVRYFLYIKDAIKGLISQMELGPSSTLDFAGEETTFGEMLRVIARLDNRKHRLLYILDHEHEKVISPNTKATKALLEWMPEVTFEEGMRRLYKWVKEELKSELH